MADELCCCGHRRSAHDSGGVCTVCDSDGTSQGSRCSGFRETVDLTEFQAGVLATIASVAPATGAVVDAVSWE